MKFISKRKNLLPLAFIQLRYRNTGPAADYPGDLILSNGLMNERQIFLFQRRLLTGQLSLNLRKLTVLKSGSFIEIALLLCRFDLAVYILDLLAQRAEIVYRILLIVPLCLL